jgi:hypothetical protein
VKKLALSWAALSLIPPLVILSFLMFGSVLHSYRRTSLAASSSTPQPGPTSANVQVGFVTTITGQPPSGLQNIFLNVTAVRLNPKPRPGAKNQGIPAEGDLNWRAIPVPAGVGIGINGKPGDLQIDMIAGQGRFQPFNTSRLRPDHYSSVEVVLDTKVPGSIVPVCSSGGGAIEGCVAYPMALQNPGNQISFVSSSQIVTAKNTLTQLPLQLNMQIISKPSGPGEPYVVSVTTAPAPGNASQFLAHVSGSVGPAASNATVKNTIRHLQVSAEVAGTNTIVGTSIVNLAGQYSFFLPAAADLGTLYDFFVSGGQATYEAARGVPSSAGGLVFPGQSYTLNFNNAIGNQNVGTIGGQITDICTNKPISGATLEILQPPDGSSADCATSPSQCVSVGFANTDNGGRYPLPGTFQQPAYFNNVPIGAPTNYTVQISASGYDNTIVQAQASGATSGTHSGVCDGSNVDAPSCDFALTTSYIAGSVALTGAPPPSDSTDVQVLAEQSGTNNLVAALAVPLLFQTGESTMNFSLNVPSKIASFDLFASAADLYLGEPNPYPGHTIITQSAVPAAPTACATSTVAPFSEPMDCTGHASIAGTAINPDSGTTVELSKGAVQLMQAAVGPATPAPSVGNTYSFCAPPDPNYFLQRLEQGSPVGTSAVVGVMPTPMPVTAIPTATNSPCPTTCFNVGNATCPGLCGTTIQPPL